jgi:hypothetical protein
VCDAPFALSRLRIALGYCGTAVPQRHLGIRGYKCMDGGKLLEAADVLLIDVNSFCDVL